MRTAVNMTSDMAAAGREIIEAMRGAARRTVKRAADVIAAEARRRVPVVSGTLRDSIRGRTRKTGENQFGAAVSTQTKGKWKNLTRKNGEPVRDRTGKVVRKIEKYGYGADVEVGRPGRYRGTPYLRPALLASVGDVRRTIVDESQREAARQSRRARRRAT